MYIERMFKRSNVCWQMSEADRDGFRVQKAVERHQLAPPVQVQVPEKRRRKFSIRRSSSSHLVVGNGSRCDRSPETIEEVRSTRVSRERGEKKT